MGNYSLLPVYEVARVVLETQTPLSISDGQTDGLLGNLIVRDANDLPTIPGSSSAGVLRSLFAKTSDNAAMVDTLFGRAGSGNPDETASQLQVSWGCLHDKTDQPVTGLLMGDARQGMQEDAVLADALKVAPVKRNRVRLDHLGCAADQGLFNRVALTAGHRFSLELSLRHDGSKADAWQQLLALLAQPEFRLGGGTRSGLGALQIVRMHQTRFDLRKSEDFKRLASLSPDVGNVAGFCVLAPAAQGKSLNCQLELLPCDFFRIGQGVEPLKNNQEHEPKLIPITEHRVCWGRGEGCIEKRRLLIPTTGIKGALRHRMAYHDRVLQGTFADQNPPDDVAAESNLAVQDLFGFAADEKDSTTAEVNHRGRVLLDDLYLEVDTVQHITHNGIDAFTGGVLQHVLYREEVVTQSAPLKLTLTIIDGDKIARPTRQALQRSLMDLIEGRLALGAGSSRGHGFFTGKLTWNDEGRWIRGEA